MDAVETLELTKRLTDLVQSKLTQSMDNQIQQLASTVENLAK